MNAKQNLPGLIALIATLISVAPAATALAQNLASCRADTGVGTACTCPLSSLHPTQVAVGMSEVEKRVAKIKGMGQANLWRYEQCRPVPLIIGPRELSGSARFYLTDHHHLARALLDAGEKSALCFVVDSQLALSETEFRDWMTKSKKVWLFDEVGKPVTFEQLPEGLKELRDDPYRSLAWAVEKRDGFYKPCSDFGEFAWANFFSTHGAKGEPGVAIATADEIRANLKKVAKLATELAQSDAARELPGYKGNPKPQCPAVPTGCEDE
jgi:hypothetical protein